MMNLIKAELRKILGKKSILIIWGLLLAFGFVLIRNFDIMETYSDIFYKIEGSIPLMGLVMFIAISGNYTKEYESNMAGLINTTKNGKKYICVAKGIAGGIALSLINVSFVLVIGLRAFILEGFKNLNDPITNLWYFGNSGSNITIIQMYLIVIGTVILGSVLLAQIGLLLSSSFKSSAIPFILGGVIMAVPFFLTGLAPKEGLKFVALTPNFIMMSQLMVRHAIPVTFRIISFLLSTLLIIVLPLVAYKNFTNSRKL